VVQVAAVAVHGGGVLGGTVALQGAVLVLAVGPEGLRPAPAAPQLGQPLQLVDPLGQVQVHQTHHEEEPRSPHDLEGWKVYSGGDGLGEVHGRLWGEVIGVRYEGSGQ
jgi:hypothetical protein